MDYDGKGGKPLGKGGVKTHGKKLGDNKPTAVTEIPRFGRGRGGKELGKAGDTLAEWFSSLVITIQTAC